MRLESSCSPIDTFVLFARTPVFLLFFCVYVCVRVFDELQFAAVADGRSSVPTQLLAAV